jgi:putative exporter of polyketide antibiotics
MGLVPAADRTGRLHVGRRPPTCWTSWAGLLELPEAILDLSPFRHLAAVPAADVDVGAAAVMLAVALVGVVVGSLALRRRDLQEA